jgi:hypothetical protein
VPCRKCGYPLLGLREPRCPECGTWTDVTRRVRTYNLRFITNRLESLGTADEWLVRSSSKELLWTCRLDDVEELRLVNRWRPQVRRWMIILAGLSLAEALAFFVVLAFYPGPQPAIGVAAFMAAGMFLAVLGVGLDPDRWVLVHTAGRSWRVPLYLTGESKANAAVERLRQAIEAGRGRPPTPEPDPQAEEVKEGCCRRCGYDLRGPRLMIDVPAPGARFGGSVAILFSLMFPICSGAMPLGYMFDGPDPLPCAAILGISVIAFISGICLFQRKQEGPAVPGWQGPGQCSACGWRPEGDTPPVAPGRPDQDLR